MRSHVKIHRAALLTSAALASVWVACVPASSTESPAGDRLDKAILIELPSIPQGPALGAELQPPAPEATGSETTGSVRLPEPDAPPPVVIPAEPAEPEVRLALPEPPPPVIIPVEPLAADIRLALPEPPPEVVVPVTPPVAVVPEPARPESSEPAARTVVATIPADVLKQSLQRLASNDKLTEREAQAVLAFYEARNFEPLWIDDGRWNARAEAARAALSRAADFGLEPDRYRTVSAFIPVAEPHFPALAAAEAALSEAAVLYAREATVGRIAPGRVHPLITPDLRAPDAQQVLSALASASDIGSALEAHHPPHPTFKALAAHLAELRSQRTPVARENVIPAGPPLRVGMRDPRVPLIRAKLGLTLSGEQVYDRALAVRVASLQRESGLSATGAFTEPTRRALIGEGPSADEAEIIANMERWRWVPRDLGQDHVFVNIPELTVRLQRGDETVFQSRIIVGKEATQTPFFSDEMDHIVVNPSWYVPPGILKREPKYLDPAYAASRGYEIRRRGNSVTVRVPPSSSNALGNVKFMFPNSHAVYLHDTPGRHLFNASNRTLSNGCVRVENPLRLAAHLFAEQGWTEERFRGVLGRGERYMRLPRKLPVHLTHFTLTVGPDGQLQRHPDIYGHSARLRQLLGLS